MEMKCKFCKSKKVVLMRAISSQQSEDSYINFFDIFCEKCGRSSRIKYGYVYVDSAVPKKKGWWQIWKKK